MKIIRKEYLYRTGFLCISQCWLANGYEIKTLHLDGKRRVVFNLTSKSKNTASVDIPEIIKYGRIPNDAKYELENYFKYILKKIWTINLLIFPSLDNKTGSNGFTFAPARFPEVQRVHFQPLHSSR